MAHELATWSGETVTTVKTPPWPWWQPHLYAAAVKEPACNYPITDYRFTV